MKFFFNRINKLEVPVLLLINKVDTSDQNILEEQVAYWKEKVPRAEIFSYFGFAQLPNWSSV